MKYLSKKDLRTNQQSRALHLYFQQVAEALNDAGLEIKEVIPEADVPWTKETVKENIWRIIQWTMLLKKSTKELTKEEVGEVYNVVNRYLAQHGIHIPFPSYDND